MKLLITSDIHRDLERLELVYLKHQNIDYHLDAGDSGLKDTLEKRFKALSVKGNNDFGNNDPAMRIIDLNGLKILLIHGHKQSVKLNLSSLKKLGKDKKVNICIFGHTHNKHLMAEENILYINPGALGKKPHSYAIYEDGLVTFYEENGK